MFKKIYCEITNVCNLSCSFCKKTSKKSEFIIPENFSHLLEKIKNETESICLHVLGEPLLHPHFDEIRKLCKNSELPIDLVTNGFLIDNLHNYDGIRKISISLHSFFQTGLETDAELEIYIQRLDAKLKYFDGIIEYRLWNEKSGYDDSNNRILNFLSKSLNIDITEKTQKLGDKIFLSVHTPFIWPSLSEKAAKGNYCHALKQHIAILTDGTVVPCCLDVDGIIDLGNIYKTDLKTILSSERVKLISDSFKKRKLAEELCKHCNFIEKFN